MLFKRLESLYNQMGFLYNNLIISSLIMFIKNKTSKLDVKNSALKTVTNNTIISWCLSQENSKIENGDSSKEAKART